MWFDDIKSSSTGCHINFGDLEGAVGISVAMDRDLKILWGSISNLAKPFHLSHRDDKHTSPQIPLQSDIS